VLITLDVTEDVLQEAASNGCNLVIAHHPVIFSGLKKITGRNYVERIVEIAIKKDIAIYAIHTNLDNMLGGVNAKIASMLGMKNTSILVAKQNTLYKLYTYVPKDAIEKVRASLFAAGAGNVGMYEECSFNVEGKGSFKPGKNTNPTIGEAGGPTEWVEEIKLEVLVQQHQEAKVLQALFASHPYEEVAYELIPLQNNNQDIGAGMIGSLSSEMSEQDFLSFLKNKMKVTCIRHTELLQKPVKKVAVCGGAGSFLLKEAMAAGADIFITADYKYHQFFDAEKKIIIADIGHYESEQFTKELIAAILTEKIPTFAPLLSKTDTNPVKYFY
jgi:dinuclear metal center YbgI/SA1388 family protein